MRRRCSASERNNEAGKNQRRAWRPTPYEFCNTFHRQADTLAVPREGRFGPSPHVPPPDAEIALQKTYFLADTMADAPKI